MFRTTGAIISSISTDTIVLKAQLKKKKKKKDCYAFPETAKIHKNVMSVGAVFLQNVPLLPHPLFSPQLHPQTLPYEEKPVPKE